MTRNAKVSVTVVAVVVAVVGALLLLNRPERGYSPEEAGAAPPTAPASVLVRPDSHKLSEATDGKVTIVEFLDLECEACGAAFPGVERLRAEYGDRVTFVMRYFPIPSHRNAELAARAVEAAGQQGKLEPMYRLMYENQPQWGDQQVSHRDTFLGFARELGLDLPRFEAALDDPATIARVRKDRDDGTTLGVRGTPTFFVNGVKFPGAPTYEALKAAIERQLAKK
ncbi:Periplasmic thiol:disulfide interchange protein DsbA [Alloactinosynnema sp. L-07]|uniref:DsbA family protein n=1 Tax=Alloactinosynnema sp. L-07 TaxID=1653480 RepID=UPI00065F0761|nr:thioredoxin domain-containing protein [Alloactinosynnema sp. L-07]CRK55335.1 Periplasmic thiol:disulfide interchange protein DsbA [Alloactinosynnema sp. L-07]